MKDTELKKIIINEIKKLNKIKSLNENKYDNKELKYTEQMVLNAYVVGTSDGIGISEPNDVRFNKDLSKLSKEFMSKLDYYSKRKYNG